MQSRTASYLETVLWAETVCLPVSEDELIDGFMETDGPLSGIEECTPLDDHFWIDSFTDEAVKQADQDCDDFFDALKENGLYESALEYAHDDHIAHDFWLTRNCHGAGFWDGDYGDIGDKLTEIAQGFGERHVWVDTDGNLHFEG